MTGNTLRELEQLALAAHADAIAAEARSLAERAAKGRFYVACVGQYKRGKSTLLPSGGEEPSGMNQADDLSFSAAVAPNTRVAPAIHGTQTSSMEKSNASVMP